MSTVQLSDARFADIERSLLHYATDAVTSQSMSELNGELARALDSYVFNVVPIAQAVRTAVFDWKRLNAAAFARRYERDAEPVRASRPRGHLLSLCALLKALRCLSYNCDGGKDSADSLARLDRVIAALTDYIVTHLPEYEAAGWFDAND